MNPSFGEDDRFQVEFTAQQTERRNSSARLLVLGIVVVVICSFIWIWGWRAKASAVASLKARQNQQYRVESMLRQIESLRSQGVDMSGGGQPINDMGTRLKRIADRAGITELPIPSETSEDAAGGRLRFYKYDQIDVPTLGPVLEWMARATDPEEGIDGLELYSLTIDPDKNNEEWTVSVHFRRWESAP